MRPSIYFMIPVLLFLALLQTAVTPRLPIAGVIVNLIFVVVIAGTLSLSWEDGIAWAFVGGILLDLFSVGPFGARSLALILTVLSITAVQRTLPRHRLFVPFFLSGVATVFFTLIYTLLVWASGNGLWLGTTTWLPLIVLHSLLILPLYWLILLITGGFRQRRVRGPAGQF